MGEDKDSPPAYRLLRRTQDIIGAVIAIVIAVLAIFKWFYLRPIQTDERIARLEERFSKQEDMLENIMSQMEATNRRLTEFQGSFKVGGKGRWSLQGNGWKWIPEK